MFGRTVRSVSVDELAARRAAGESVLIDVREPKEFATGHVPGAVNVPLRSLIGESGRFDPEMATFVICQHGRRSQDAARVLSRAGFKHVYSVAGGTSAWRGKLER